MIPRKVSGYGTMPATGNLVVDLGGPTANRVWMVRHSTYLSVPPDAAFAGNHEVFLCVGQPLGPNDGLPAPSEVVDYQPTTVVPGPPSTWGRGEIVVEATDHLYAVLHTATAGTPFCATVRFEEWRWDELDRVY